MEPIFRGDDTGAFGQNWLRVNVDIPPTWIVSRAEMKIGNILLNFESPEFPIIVNLTSAQTEQLNDSNTCYIALYDEDNLKKTIEGTYCFKTRKRVV